MMKQILAAALLAALATGAARADDLDWLEAYNVAWTTPSANSSESMPVGGHDVGLNVWVEDGEVRIYLARAGCYDENGALLKLGRVRVQLDPNPFAGDGYFRQELKLREGCVEIRAGRGDEPEATVRVWVEVHRPVAHVEIEADEELDATATYESWRYEPMELSNDRSKYGRRGMVMMDYDQYAGEVVVQPDVIEPREDGVVFSHRNRDQTVFDFQVRQQALEAVRDQMHDRLARLTFGGRLDGDQLVADGTTEGVYANTPFRGWRYRTQAPARRHHLRVVTHLAQTETLDEWQHDLQALSDAADPSRDEAWQQNRSWWQSFWQRSRIVINPEKAGTGDAGWQVGRNYNVFRYMLASNHAGSGATPFNGGLFTFDPLHSRQRRQRIEGAGYSPDHRQWGAGLTQQNQRIIYWPMLKSGDFDLMPPGFSFYLDDNLINATVRVRHYWDHEGCAFAEQPSITGLPGAAMYGFHEGEGTARVRPGSAEPDERTRHRYSEWWPGGLEPGVEANAAAGNLFDSQLDWAWMMLEYHRFTGEDLAPFLPFIEQAVVFFDEHYRFRNQQRTGQELDEDGKLVIYPTNSLEAHPAARNPSLPILGLHQILTRLLELPDEISPPERKQRWRAILGRLPDLPVVESGGRRILRPAENFSHRSWHMPEMYGLWPFQVYGLELPDLELMRDTFLHGVSNRNRERVAAWTQGFIHYARLGMASQAQEKAVGKLGNGPYRFPAFWPEDIDWVPDHNWGGAGMVGLQEMLLQTHTPPPASLHGKTPGETLRLGPDGEMLRLLPAWPQDWDVDFRLHAPRQTVVEGRVRDGQLVSWNVTPEQRRGDVVIPDRP